MSLMYNSAAYGIYLTGRYHKAVWGLQKKIHYEFFRLDSFCYVNQVKGAPPTLGKFFGYYMNIKEYELKVYLYKVQCVTHAHMSLLHHSRQTPDMILLYSGTDPGDYFPMLAHEFSQVDGVKLVIPLEVKKNEKIDHVIMFAHNGVIQRNLDATPRPLCSY